MKKKIKRIISLGFNYNKGEYDGSFLVKNNVDCVRLNFSHLNHGDALKIVNEFREKYPEIKILQDIQGQKWRVDSSYKNREKLIKKGETVIFCSKEKYLEEFIDSDDNYIPVNIEADFSILNEAQEIMMKDGSVKFKVIDNKAKEDEFIVTESESTVMIRCEKSINIPVESRGKINPLTEKDKRDIEWGIKNKVDIICLSFVNKKEDIKILKEYINTLLNKDQKIPIIWAKIETISGYENFKFILEVVDGLMIARGDLIPELGRFESSIAQYDMLEQFKDMNSSKDLIIATHIFDSLISLYNKNPSITNLNDIYLSAREGATGFMLTSEVGFGKQPKKAIEVLDEYLSFLENKLF